MSRIIASAILFTLLMLPAGSHAADRLEKIQKNNELRVCIWPGYFAISYRNPRTGQLEGIDIDMAHEFAKYLKVNLKFVDSSFGKIKENMTNDACDISMHGVGVRDDRKPFMDFSEPHLISGIYAISMKSNPTIKRWEDIDQKDHIVVVQKGTYMEPIMREYLKKAELSVVDSFKAREQEVEAGRADVFMTDFPYGRRMASLTTWAHLMEPKKTLAPTPYAYAVPKGEPDWLAKVNEFLQIVKKDGRLAASAKKYGLSPIVAK